MRWEVSPEELFSEKRRLLGRIFLRWVRMGKLGCRFARRLARDHLEADWAFAVEDLESDTPTFLRTFLDDAERSYEAVSLVFPHLTTAHDAARLIGTLCADSQWSWEEIPWKDDPPPRCLLVGLRWKPRLGDYVSWVLGFGPFEPMPFTRLIDGAPFIALAFRPSPPTFEPEKRRAHLAHMPDLLATERDREEYRKTTKLDKEAFVPGLDLEKAARARVTFCLPFELRERLPSPTNEAAT